MPADPVPAPDCPHVAAFDVVVRRLRRQPILQGAIRHWCVWDGSPSDEVDPCLENCPYLALAPSVGDSAWRGPSDAEAPLIVTGVLYVAGTDARKLLNLYWQVKRGLLPKLDADRVAIRRQLLDAGATTGEMTFSAPSVGRADDEQGLAMLAATFRITLDVTERLNP